MAPPPSTTLFITNQQRARKLDIRAVERLTIGILKHLNLTAELGIQFVGPKRMAELNWQFLQHEGSTDVITFDHGSTPSHLFGDIAISVADAITQAQEFGTEWPEEVARYVIHGILHLLGYDDLVPAKRRVMKQAENRLVRHAIQQDWHRLQRS
jgi:probable rRNA maturation factor